MIKLIIALFIFVISYLVIITDIIPPSIASVLGAISMFVFGILSGKEILSSIDFEVIILIASMMIIVDVVAETGLFEYTAVKSAQIVRGDPFWLLIFLSIISACFSAFLDNVTTIIVMIPVSILLSEKLDINPIPFIIAESIAANIGGSATLIGDPPNIIIGSYSQYSFNEFLINLGPIALINLVVFVILSRIFFMKDLKISKQKRELIMNIDASEALKSNAPFKRYISIFLAVIIGFMLHKYFYLPPSLIAIIGASIIILLTRKDPDKFLSKIDWNTIFFFVGLFIIVGGVEKTGVLDFLARKILSFTKNDLSLTSMLIFWLSNVASAFIDNIPFTVTLAPMIKNTIIPAIMKSNDSLFLKQVGYALWWSLSLGACLGGNGTLVGSSSNIVAANIANRKGYKISFCLFTKYGMVFATSTAISSCIYIWARYL